jgi:hypothetical protein
MERQAVWGSGGERLDVGEHGAEGDGKWGGVAAGLGEDQPTLDSGEQGEGDPVGIGLGAEFAALTHDAQPGADGFHPPVKAGSEIGPRLRIVVGEFGRERPERAAAGAAAPSLELDEDVSPGVQRLDAVESAQHWLLGVEHRVGLPGDHDTHEGALVEHSTMTGGSR